MKTISALILFSALTAGWAQAKEPTAVSEDLRTLETEMAGFFDAVRSAKTDTERLAYHDSLRVLTASMLSFPESFTYGFPKLTSMAVLTSDDGLFRIFNWNIPKDDNTHTYGCFFMWKSERRKTSELHWSELTPIRENGASLVNTYMTPEKWKGALYYEIVTVSQKKDTYYLLLGWDGANGVINRKIIEAVTFNGDKVRLGAPVFKVDKGSPKRFIMEYSEEVMASLRYRKSEKRIVFDHLAPRAPGLEGNPAFYGPDLTFDAFVLENGKWVFQQNVEVTMSKEESNRPYKDPRRVP